MIRGVVVLLKSGLLVAQRGFEKSEVLTPLMSAAIGLSEEMGIGILKGLEYRDLKLYMLTSYINPDVIIVVAADREDPTIELRARELASKIDRVLPRRKFDIVTGEIQDSVLRIIDSFLKEKPELPGFENIVNLAKVVYSSMPSEKLLEFENKASKFEKKELAEEERKKFTPKKIAISNPDKMLRTCLEKIFDWSLYDAYSIAYALKDVPDYKDIGSLLATKIGLILLSLPPEYPSVSSDEIKKLLNVSAEKLDPKVIEFVKLEALAFLEGKIRELRSFIVENRENLAKIFDAAEEPIKGVYAFLLYSASRHIVQSTLGSKLMEYFKDKSMMLYEILKNAETQVRIFDILYSSKTWLEIHEIVSETKINYLEIQRKYDKILKKTFIQKLFTSWKKDLIETSAHALSRIRPYMLAILAAAESYGLSIKDREKLLKDTYNLVKEDALNIIKADPPLDLRVYFDFYQLILHLMMYLSTVVYGEEAKKIWQETINISQEGFKFFHKLYLRNRISKIDFMIRVSPIVFVMSKAAINIGEIPEEIIEYIRTISKLEEEEVEQLDNRVEASRFADIINSLLPILIVSKLIQLESIREKIVKEILRILRTLGSWSIHKGTYSREFVDNFADAINEVLEVSKDKHECRIFLRDLLDYINVLVKNPEENRFEAALMYEKAGKLIAKYTYRFGAHPELVPLALNYLETSAKIWSEGGYRERADDIEYALRSLKASIS